MKTWKERVEELEASGMTLTDIAGAVDSSTSVISEIKQGRSKSPRGMTAVKLHELHTRTCGEQAA